jgi:hypothetical protein
MKQNGIDISQLLAAGQLPAVYAVEALLFARLAFDKRLSSVVLF